MQGRQTRARVRISISVSGDPTVIVQDYIPDGVVVVLGLADHPIDSNNVMLFHKQGDRDIYDQRRVRAGHVDDVVLWNEKGQVTETTTANLAVLIVGRWWTPSLTCGLLPGVERRKLLDAGVLTEREISIEDLQNAESVAVISSLRGWRRTILRDREPERALAFNISNTGLGSG